MRPSLLPGPRKALNASVAVPSSKSLTNRAMILAAAAGGGSVLSPLDCEDTRLLAQALAAAGWRVDWDDIIEIGERRVPDERVTLDLGNSGTGARLLLSLLAAVPAASWSTEARAFANGRWRRSWTVSQRLAAVYAALTDTFRLR